VSRLLIAFGAASAVLALTAGVILLCQFDPNAASSPFPPCMLFMLTEMYCPGCGLTRALHAVVHFDLLRALAMNAFVVVSLPVLAAMCVQATSGRRLLPPTLDRLAHNGYLWIAALLMFGVARNLPAFEWLAPGGLL
jgi:hypothetical protein